MKLGRQTQGKSPCVKNLLWLDFILFLKVYYNFRDLVAPRLSLYKVFCHFILRQNRRSGKNQEM